MGYLVGKELVILLFMRVVVSFSVGYLFSHMVSDFGFYICFVCLCPVRNIDTGFYYSRCDPGNKMEASVGFIASQLSNQAVMNDISLCKNLMSQVDSLYVSLVTGPLYGRVYF